MINIVCNSAVTLWHIEFDETKREFVKHELTARYTEDYCKRLLNANSLYYDFVQRGLEEFIEEEKGYVYIVITNPSKSKKLSMLVFRAKYEDYDLVIENMPKKQTIPCAFEDTLANRFMYIGGSILSGAKLIELYEKNVDAFEYKLSDAYKRDYEDFEDPWADGFIGNGSEYYIGWNAKILNGGIPVFYYLMRGERCTSLFICLDKKVLPKMSPEEWKRIMEDTGVITKNPDYSEEDLIGWEIDISKNIGHVATFDSYKNPELCGVEICVGFGHGVHTQQQPYLFEEFRPMSELKAYLDITKRINGMENDEAYLGSDYYNNAPAFVQRLIREYVDCKAKREIICRSVKYYYKGDMLLLTDKDLHVAYDITNSDKGMSKFLQWTYWDKNDYAYLESSDKYKWLADELKIREELFSE